MLKSGAIGIVVAVVAVAITFLIGDAVSGPFMTTQPGSDVAEEAMIGGALGFTVFFGLIGIGIAALTKRFSNPAKVFLTICVVALVIYGVFPFLAADEVSTAIWLNVMHIAAAVPIVGMLVRELQGAETQAPVAVS